MKSPHPNKARKLGRGLTLLFIVLGLGVAALILGGVLLALAWEFPFYAVLVSLGLFGSGFFFGGFLGEWILLKKGSPTLYGILCSIIVLTIGTSFLVLSNFLFLDSLRFQGPGAIEDYLLKPFAAVFTYGIVPTLILGVLLGWTIKKLGEKRVERGE